MRRVKQVPRRRRIGWKLAGSVITAGVGTPSGIRGPSSRESGRRNAGGLTSSGGGGETYRIQRQTGVRVVDELIVSLKEHTDPTNLRSQSS